MNIQSLSSPEVGGSTTERSFFWPSVLNVRGLCVAGALLAYCVGVLFCIFNRRPSGNEAWFANPAVDLMVRHKMGTPVLASNLTWLAGIDQHTYWTMPLYSLIQVPWYSVFGFSLMSQRLLSFACGLGVLWCVHRLVIKLSTPWAAALSVILISCDWMFIRESANGRMDMLSALFGFGGLAIYISLRETRFKRAMLLANTAVVASCMTHPWGLLATTSLWALILYLDWKSLKWRDIGLAAIPYCVAALSWGAYISRAPASFLLQMRTNSKGVASELGGRNRIGELNPFKAFNSELHLRYINSYHSRLIPIIYLLGLAVIIFLAWKTRRKEHVVFAVIGVLYFTELTMLEGLRSENYLVHPIPALGMALAVALCSIPIRSKLARRFIVFLAIGILLSRQAATARWFGNDAAASRDYFSALNLVAANHSPGEELIAPANLGYKLGFYSGLDEDWQIGYLSGKKPKLIVLGKLELAWVKVHQNDSDDFGRFVDHRLNVEYAPVLENPNYTVYERRDQTVPLAVPPDSRHVSVAKMYLELRPPR